MTLQSSPATLASGNAVPTYHSGKKGKSPLTAYVRRDPVNPDPLPALHLQVDLQGPLSLLPSQRPHSAGSGCVSLRSSRYLLSLCQDFWVLCCFLVLFRFFNYLWGLSISAVPVGIQLSQHEEGEDTYKVIIIDFTA